MLRNFGKVERKFEETNTLIDDIDVVIPHQANARIIESAAKNLNISLDIFRILKMEIPMQVFLLLLDEYLEKLDSREAKKLF